ncbi:MAG: type I-E CRISPR-associated protein Cas5/CasD [Rhodobacteraceae bacterium]|uniref:type I-E CRISPR-associated protein Cas5/CasD n=1 Tax=Amaricoccus sp. TaxID=1872485 RepID=UPI001DF3E8CC|nr:type I-E CRISPR-associated protein Cas5/CasD [Amaricoccus sp.]MCB1374357.1 type I-E CRISPR-associated protein Cas5/CasD [Paracoccaceae bacterium]MCB1403052.1 type I-E CRISPR-associated protein Cas5/CasD [Paracoccaceae bacterium]MCC0066847.1 type I-E CRISPR-associated protein Cas5/CasD [Rhodovulum sp.]HRW15311.1 type I-E CRISPR-associated protein Cas5/CasD [Amaricoccus sp.]
MTHRWLHLRLAAPLVAFGGVAIDHVGPTRDFPSASALTGIFANALGWRREDRAAHQALQDRMVFGTLNPRPGRVLTDNQNARLEARDRGWTTWGRPEGRAGATYDSPHRRRRDYLADHDCRVVLRLVSGDGPTLDALAEALERPARPLFIGRKSCLPSGPLFAGWVEAPSVHAALLALGLSGPALWPENGAAGSGTGIDPADLRNWHSGLHAGQRRVVAGRIA